MTLAPTVTAIVANSGTNLGGTPVTISGTNFTGATSVTIGGNPATNVTVSNATTITATTPAGTGSNVPVVVTTPAGASPAANLYSYVAVPPPTVTAVSPNHGSAAGGTSITITGTNFTGASAVTIGGSAAQFVNVVSATSITAVIPAHAAGVVDLTVTTPAGTSATSAADQFTYVAAPAVTTVSPATGPPAGGTTVTITGTGFTGATSVTIGGSPATGITVNGSGTSITAITPAHVAGIVDVVVTSPTGNTGSSGAGLFTYVTPAPTVTAIALPSGSTLGGTLVTITGTNFTGATAVTIGGNAATSVTVTSATTITAITPCRHRQQRARCRHHAGRPQRSGEHLHVCDTAADSDGDRCQ